MANEKRVRLAFQSGELDATLTDSGTSITFAAAPDFATLASDEHIALILDPFGEDGAPEIVYITAYTAMDATATIVRAQEGTTAREHLSGTAWHHGSTLRDVSAGRVALARYTGGNITINSTSWTNFQTGLDLAIAAQAGDVVEVGLSGRWVNEASNCALDVVSIVSGSPVNSWATDGAVDASGRGIGAWFGASGEPGSVGGSIARRIVSGDVSGGVLTLRFRAMTLTANNKTMNATSASPVHVWAKNQGPQVA